MNPEPPPVTIVDPHAPPGTADLLAGGRDPWRPSRPQLRVIVLAVLAALVVAAGAAEVTHVRAQQAAERHEKALDRAAIAAVSLRVGVQEPAFIGESPESPPLQLTVTNAGPGTVHLTSLALDGVAVPVEFGSDVAAGATNGYELPPRTTCGDRAGRMAGRTVALALTTDRGDPVSQEVPLNQEANDTLNGADRARCRTFLPSEALAASPGLARRSGRWVLLDLTLANQSVLPLTLEEISFPDGLEGHVSGLPLVLPTQASGDFWTGARTVSVRVRVTSCQAWATGEPMAITATVEGRFEREVADLQLAADDEGPDNPGLFSLLATSCPGLELFRA